MKVGIIGSGVIVHQALDCIDQIDDIECTALWCREQDLESAKELVLDHGVKGLYTNLSEFLNCNQFDTVYIGVINSLHYYNVKEALLAGKNVICEKPFTPTGEEAKELFDLAKEKHLFIFEAIMLRYLNNYEMIKEKLKALGPIKLVMCNYSQYSRRYDLYLKGTVLPAFDPKLAGGCVYDINIYCIHFVMGLFGKPQSSQYYPSIGFNGIDVNGVMILDYDKFKAVCIGAKDSNSKPFCSIQGEKGYIYVDSMPGQVENITITMNKEAPVAFGEHVENPMINEFNVIKKIVDSENYELCYQYMENSVEVMDTVEKARVASGVVFA